jgi:PAS domain S-box-containing protein
MPPAAPAPNPVDAQIRQLLETVLDNIPQGVFWKDRESRYLGCNRVVAHAWGLESPARIVGLTDDDLPGLTPDQANFFRAIDREVIETGEARLGIIEQATLVDGRTIWLETNKIPFRDERGAIIGVLGTWQDITARRTAEEALVRSEALLAEAQRIGRVGSWEVDFERDEARWSPEGFRLLGLEPGAQPPSQQVFLRLVHPEDRDAVADEFARAFAARTPLANEFRVTLADGSVRWLLSRGHFTLNDDGQPTRLTGVTIDTTERRLADEQIRRSEERYRAFIRQTSEGIWRYEVHPPMPVSLPEEEQLAAFFRDGGLVECNDALARMYGLERAEDLIGTRLGDLMIANDPRNRSYLLGFIRGGYRLENGESLDRDVTGAPRWFLNSLVGTVENGLLVSAWGVQRDITERKLAEVALRHSEARLAAVTATMPHALYVYDLDDGATVFRNRDPWVDLGHVGREKLSREEFLEEFLHPDDRDRNLANAERWRTLDDGETFESEFRLRDAAGEHRWFRARDAVYERHPDGRVRRILGTIEDITERRRQAEERARLEAQLQHAQKLESLGVLAGGIAHDFNNLLTGILGYADLALLDVPADSPARPHIAEAMHGARRAAELTRQMLAYSGKGRFIVQPLSLSSVIEEMARLLAISISKSCVIRYRLPTDLPAIEADPAQIRQVIMNLVINASEAIGERSGVIAVTTGFMHCDREYLSGAWLDDGLPAGRYAFLEVADNGCGMNEETRRRIFDPFFTTKFTGRGLGLSAVMGIIRGHRGAIKCYSEPDQGTTFKALFPVAEGVAAVEVSPREAGSAWTGAGLALAVDDEESVRTLAAAMLDQLGFSVLQAGDGREALQRFRERADEIRVVLLDMTMPHLDGAETFRELRRIRPDVRVILSSGYNRQTATSRFAGKGLAGFIQKPYRLDELREAVRIALEQD